MARKKKAQASSSVPYKTVEAARHTSTLSRLATTVKVDLPGFIGAGADAIVGKPAAAVSKFAQRLLPKGLKKRAAAQKVDKLAREGGLTPASKRRRVRRSRLPWVIAFLVAMAASGAYYTYEAISIPSLGVGKYLDYEKWLHSVSGGSPLAGAKRSSNRPLANSAQVHQQRKADHGRAKLKGAGKGKKGGSKKKSAGSPGKSKRQLAHTKGAGAKASAGR